MDARLKALTRRTVLWIPRNDARRLKRIEMRIERTDSAWLTGTQDEIEIESQRVQAQRDGSDQAQAGCETQGRSGEGEQDGGSRLGEGQTAQHHLRMGAEPPYSPVEEDVFPINPTKKRKQKDGHFPCLTT